MPIWSGINLGHSGPLSQWSDEIRRAELSQAGLLPDLSGATSITLANDYAGEDRTVDYNVHALLLADVTGSLQWKAKHQAYRVAMRDNRKMEFKKLDSDKVRQGAFGHFMSAANSLNGVVVVLLIHKSANSLFEIDSKFPPPTGFNLSLWKPSQLERVLRVIYVNAFFLAGLSRKGQNVVWLSDNDEILANKKRMDEFMPLFVHVASLYLPHTLGEIGFGTTGSCGGNIEIEDLHSIPDLACGAYTEYVTAIRRANRWPAGNVMVPSPDNLSQKTRAIVAWLSSYDRATPLKRLVFAVNPVANSKTLELSWIRTHAIGPKLAI